MVWRDCKGPVVTCIACAGVLTFCLSTFGDQFAQDPGGPLFWIVSAVVGMAVGALAGLLACVLARSKEGRQLLPEPDLDSAKIADEREVRVLRYLLGISLSVVGVVITLVFVLEAIRSTMPSRF